jgi:hypothetical protein
MSEKPIIVKIIKTCDACPTQWEGTTDKGEYVYIRYRCAHLRAGMGKTESEMWKRQKADGTWDVYNMFQEKVGEGFDGWMEYEKMKEHLKDVFVFPETESPFEYDGNDEP